MRIVALLGSSDLNHDPERRVLNNLRPLVAEIVFPNNLNNVINELNQGCDILYFGGHGVTRRGRGFIQFNNALLESRFFANSLKEAVKRGLKLAIFFSCEGIGLLEDFHRDGVRIPFIIVMTGPILDEAAGRFVEVFFDKYTGGLPFINSFEAARNTLSQWEHILPGITNLPIVYQDFNASNLSVPWYIPILKFLQDIIPNRRNRRFWTRKRLYQLALALLLSLAIYNIVKPPEELAICPSYLQKDTDLKEYLSVGGNDLLNEDAIHLQNHTKNELAQGFQAFQKGCEQLNENSGNTQDIQENFERAFKIFDNYKSTAPDYYVYSQNARIYQELAAQPSVQIKNKQPYIIAVAVPRQVQLNNISQQNTGGEIINGVAAFQNIINTSSSSRKLVLLLADDKGDKSQKVAEHIGNISQLENLLLGVIGHAQTSVTREAAKIYQDKRVILISPTSTGQIRNNENQDDYIYKVVFDVKQLTKDLAEIAEKKFPSPNDKVLLIYSNDAVGLDLYQKFRSGFPEPQKLIPKTLDDATKLKVQDLQQQNVKVIIINLSVKDRDSRRFSEQVLSLAYDFVKNPEYNNIVILSDTFYNNKNLQDITKKGLCNNPNFEVVTPAWVNNQLDKKLKYDLPKSSTELYSWRIDFAFDSALILMSAAEQLKNNLNSQTLKDYIKTKTVDYLLNYSTTDIEPSSPAFDLTGNRSVNQTQQTSQVWTTESQNGQPCKFVHPKNQ